ncbi:DUF3006 domain-containing protein [Clostridium formicaceticum]|uniref:Uncharacterized protein n=1 Tax=Clostridium formicaceticum TaxID=1497 RepID=A0AAC9RK58_9CLOT|nr:DUF3006 domain-containing protein [Clostridium formicaceticum]AOY76720.1 hypothetical protein BJL90_13095 [Clostridium formicaceticum]ARE87157.1 hypothetical protein CLFO_15450 [Clostridium formicaceticum]
MKVTIDRFEGEYAVVELENRRTIDMPKSLVPEGAKEGDVLEIRIDREETDSRKKRIEELMEDLWE